MCAGSFVTNQKRLFFFFFAVFKRNDFDDAHIIQGNSSFIVPKIKRSFSMFRPLKYVKSYVLKVVDIIINYSSGNYFYNPLFGVGIQNGH